MRPTNATHHRLQTLLDKANDVESPLGEEEVDELANTLDRGASRQTYIRGTRVPYRSVDIGLGSNVVTPTPSASVRHAPVEQFSPSEQEDAFRFIKSDLRVEQRLRFTHAWIKIKGIGRTFYHYQVYGAFWMLKHERGPRRGVIEADLMGLGKTTIALLYIMFNFFLVDNAQHVRRFPGSHLRPSMPGGYQQPRDARCPLGRRWPITCRCEEGSVTRQLEVRDGASLVFVPKSLLGNWASEWHKLQVDATLPVQLYIHHGDYPGESVSPGAFKNLQLDVKDPLTTSRQPAKPCMAHQYLILTTTQSYYSRVAEYEGREMCAWTENLNPRHKRSHLNDGLAWGRLILDEAHLSVSPDTQTFIILESLSHNGWVAPNFVALTGTPMLRNGVGDMLALIRHINSISPSLHMPQLSTGNDNYLGDLVTRYRKHAHSFSMHDSGGENRAATEQSLAREVGTLQTSYCIRRHSGTMQNNKTLAWIPPLQRIDLLCPATPTAKFTMREVEAMLRRNLTLDWVEQVDASLRSDVGGEVLDLSVRPSTLLDNVLMARVVATVPALATYRPRAHLSWKHIAAKSWHLEPTSSPFFTSMADLVASSGKLQTLKEFLARWKGLVTWDQLPEQLVVLSEFALVCHIVHCFCIHQGFECRWIHAQVRTRERDEIVQAFQTMPQGQPQIRILIGSSRIMGQGLTLNRAHRLVLMEPSHHAGVEDQNADRVHRLGSETDRCWFYRMINEDSVVESMLIKHQAGQRRFQDQVEFVDAAGVGAETGNGGRDS